MNSQKYSTFDMLCNSVTEKLISKIVEAEQLKYFEVANENNERPVN